MYSHVEINNTTQSKESDNKNREFDDLIDIEILNAKMNIDESLNDEYEVSSNSTLEMNEQCSRIAKTKTLHADPFILNKLTNPAQNQPEKQEVIIDKPLNNVNVDVNVKGNKTNVHNLNSTIKMPQTQFKSTVSKKQTTPSDDSTLQVNMSYAPTKSNINDKPRNSPQILQNRKRQSIPELAAKIGDSILGGGDRNVKHHTFHVSQERRNLVKSHVAEKIGRVFK